MKFTETILVAIIGLVGVIIGSALSWIGQYLLFRSENERWKKEKKIELLKSKKGKSTMFDYIPLSDDQIDKEIGRIIDSK